MKILFLAGDTNWHFLQQYLSKTVLIRHEKKRTFSYFLIQQVVVAVDGRDEVGDKSCTLLNYFISG